MLRALPVMLLSSSLFGCLNGLLTPFEPKAPPEVWPLVGKWAVAEQTFTSNPCGARNPLLPDTLTLRDHRERDYRQKVVELDAVLNVFGGRTSASGLATPDFRPQLDCVAEVRTGFEGPSDETEIQVSVTQSVTWQPGHGQPDGCAAALAAYLDLSAYPDATDCTLTGTARLTRSASE